jgi:hypothetical protein
MIASGTIGHGTLTAERERISLSTLSGGIEGTVGGALGGVPAGGCGAVCAAVAAGGGSTSERASRLWTDDSRSASSSDP